MDKVYYVYIGIMYCVAITCFLRFKMLDLASRIFACFIALSSINETIALYIAMKVGNNMPLYAVYGLVEFAIISLYFNFSIDLFRRYNIGYFIGIIGVAFGAINIIYIQGLYKMNSYFLIFEGLCTIGMGLFSFLRLLLKSEVTKIQFYHQFWLTALLVFFWAITLTNWSLYDYFNKVFEGKMPAINVALVVFNMLIYASIGSVFLLLPKMQRKYEQ